jgi:hypothetical protein
MNDMNVKRGKKSSTIKKDLRRKIDDWLETIEDTEVRAMAKRDTIVTGGAIASMLDGQKVNDYDVYFKTMETTVAVATYYVNQFNKEKGKLKSIVKSYNPVVKVFDAVNIKGIQEKRVGVFIKSAGIAGETEEAYNYFEMRPESEADDFIDGMSADDRAIEEVIGQEMLNDDVVSSAVDLANDMKPQKKKYRPIFMSENAITLSDKIQIVTRFFGSPEEIHNNYDYAHAMCYYERGTDNLVLKPEALECILSKTLIYRGSLYPIASIFRVRKFLERGWRITAGQLMKIMFQISALDLSDKQVLREQLVGVDQMYMHQLINALKEAEGRIDETYLMKVIDEIFE